MSKPPKGRTTTVGEWIRKNLQNGNFVPGQRLVEAEICQVLDVSHSEVRTALVALSHQKLIECIPNRGARVRVVSLEEALQTAELRMWVEGPCAARAAQRITDEQIDGLRKIEKAIQTRADAGDTQGYFDLVSQLLATYIRIADQPVATEALNMLRDRNSWYVFRLRLRSDRVRVSLPLWLAIIDAICTRDPEGARAAVERRVQNTCEAMKALDDGFPFSRPSTDFLTWPETKSEFLADRRL